MLTNKMLAECVLTIVLTTCLAMHILICLCCAQSEETGFGYGIRFLN